MSIKAATSCNCNCMLLAAGLAGGLGVTLGALGSHVIYNMMDVSQLKAYNVANQYHLVHAVAMAAVAAAVPHASAAVAGHLRRAYMCFAAGIIVLSGSRYVLATVHKPAWLVKLPPVGAALLAMGWGCVTVAGIAGSK